MCRDVRPPRAAVTGFALVPAVFLITVIASLTVTMATLGMTQRATSTAALLGTRAFFAAQSGVEWATQRAVAAPGALNCGGQGPVFAPQAADLVDFVISVDCTATPVSEGAYSYTIYRLSVTAERGTHGTMDHVKRSLQAVVTQGH